MKRSLLVVMLFVFCVSIGTSCKKAYLPSPTKIDNRFLVIEGVLVKSIDSPTIFTLSRTTKLTDSITSSSPEPAAQVTVEGNDGGNFVFTEQPGGIYRAHNLLLNNVSKYRLKIITSAGDQYLSDYVEVKQTPQIDSIAWNQENDVKISAYTHDATNNTKYYRWDFIETWQYRSEFSRTIAQKSGIIYYVDSTNQTYDCWSTAYSANILTASSVALSQDIINKEPITTIPQNSEKIGIRYSILVKQYAIAQDAYQYFEILKKNTEELGSIFDAQPTQLTGNIHCINKPSQIAVGFFTASSVQQKRIFINRDDLTGWNPVNTGESCDIVKIPQDPNNFLIYNYPDPAFEPYYFSTMPSLIVLTKTSCVDCTQRGGVTIKPGFW